MRTLIFILALLLIFLWLFIAWRKPRLAGYTVPVLLWLLNVGSFYLVRITLDDVAAYELRFTLNSWSLFIYMHGLFSLAGGAVLMLWDDIVLLWDGLWKLISKSS